ncbi:MAG: formate dehydrogenase accessory sulfurtransferase FdhD [Thermoflexales bacterium]|nr:formate dehydrogenase accessory sulfurtransferase FdhD [Thermoflexales bacterium]
MLFLNGTLSPYETSTVTSYTFPDQEQVRDIHVIAEALVCVHVNGAEWVSLACTPVQQKELAVGFLLGEGVIDSLGEVQTLHVSAEGLCVEVWLSHAAQPPTRRVLTSGCGGGVSFSDLQALAPRLDSALRLPAKQVPACLQLLTSSAALHRLTGGVHASGLFKDGQLVSMAEDIGRHNTIDKIRGDCALRGQDVWGGLLVSTGRISSEMLAKAARMGCPLVASRTSATSLAVQLARAWGITLIGYVRGNRMTVYTGSERLIRNA